MRVQRVSWLLDDDTQAPPLGVALQPPGAEGWIARVRPHNHQHFSWPRERQDDPYLYEAIGVYWTETDALTAIHHAANNQGTD